MTPALPRTQVNDYYAIAPFRGGVGNVSYASAARRKFRSQIESDVIEIRICVRYGRREDNCLDDGVVGERNAD
jgi:hypothetical protein